jgi:antitoxin HicB
LGSAEQFAAGPDCAGYFLCRAGEHGAPSQLYEKEPKDAATGHRSGTYAEERNMDMKKKNIGSSVDSWLREEGIYEEVTATAIKRVLARQVEAAMKEKHFSKAEMARRMRTSRAALDRLLDPDYDAVTLSTLRKAATAVGRKLGLELV